MIGKTKYLLILLMTAIFLDAASQNSQVLYYMNLPQNHFLNPALRPSNKVYIGLPGMSGVNLNVNNSFLGFSDVFFSGQKIDSIAFLQKNFDEDKFMSRIEDNNFLKPEAAVQVFGLGFSAGRDLYVFMDYNVRVEGDLSFPRDIFTLAFSKPDQLAGNSYDLSSLKLDAFAFNEFGLGFSKNITKRLRIGIKGKLLLGLASTSLDTRSLGITVGSDYAQNWDADLMMNISGPVTIQYDEDDFPEDLIFDESIFDSPKNAVNYIFKTKNKGFGLDVGAVLDISDKFSLSAAVTDLGFINWEQDITNLQAESQFEFSGKNLQDVYNGTMTFDSLAQVFLDSLTNSISFTETKEPFTAKLPYGITAGINYDVSRKFSLGLLSYTRLVEKKYKEALTLSANVNLGNFFSTSIAYTATNYRYDNLGFGLAFRAGWLQIYALADRIPLTWDKVTNDGKNIPLPDIWNTLHARVGINLVFGNKAGNKKDDKPMIQIQ